MAVFCVQYFFSVQQIYLGCNHSIEIENKMNKIDKVSC